jgi:hypothetical protein
MPATYVRIASTTLGSAASTITFNGIPSSYTDLRWVLTGNVSSIIDIIARFNADTSSLYSITRMFGNGSSGLSSRTSNVDSIRISIGNPNDTGKPFFIAGDVFSYAGSTFKNMLSEFSGDESGTGTTGRIVGMYRSTSSITSLSLIGSGDTFTVGTTATLYGIKNA